MSNVFNVTDFLTAGLLSPRNIRSNTIAISPVITHEEMSFHAADSNTYAKAEAYQENVFDVKYAPSKGNEVVVSCQCKL